MEFKNYIKDKRIALNLSQEEASLIIGCSVSTIQNWERGTSIPDTNSIKNIAKAYSIKPGDIMYVLGQKLNMECEGYAPTQIGNNINHKEEYLSILPNNSNYSAIEGLEFNEQELELFLILSLTLEFSGDPIPSMYKKTNDYLEIALFLDKLKKYDLYTNSNGHYNNGDSRSYGEVVSKTSNLTIKGEYIYKYIKSSKNKTFNVYSLNFEQFLDICKLYRLVENVDMVIKTLKEMCNEKCYYLNTFEKDKWYEGRYDNKKLYGYIKEVQYGTLRDCRVSREEILEKYLDSDYYSIVNEECNNELYLIEKEAYEKKMEFYETHKDLNDGLIQPKKYQERIYRKAVPTKKAIKFIEYFNNK